MAGAEICFNEAHEMKAGDVNVRELVDRGLIAIAQNNFGDAYTCFQQASTLEPSNIMVSCVCLKFRYKHCVFRY